MPKNVNANREIDLIEYKDNKREEKFNGLGLDMETTCRRSTKYELVKFIKK